MPVYIGSKPVTVTQDRVADVMKSIRALTSKQVLVGVPAEGSDRKPEPGEPAINNATIGYLMEFGEPEKNIPARPHLIPGVQGALDPIVARLRKTGEKALSGDVSDVEKGLIAVGLMGQSAVRNKISEGPFTPLSARTLARRKAKGRTGKKPLVDKGLYRRAQTYVVREKGK